MQNEAFRVRPADYHRLMERMANAQIDEDQARQIIGSAEAHRAFVAMLCQGMERASGKRT